MPTKQGWPYIHITLLLIFLHLHYINAYQLNGNGGATVHGARARNSSIPLRSVIISQPNTHINDQQCEYCRPKECLNDGEDADQQELVYCYVERDKENGASNNQRCSRSDAALRRLIDGDLPNLQHEHSGCVASKRSAFIQICWCRLSVNDEEDESQKSSPEHQQQLGERNRIRFNSGRRGGLQVVRLQSAEDSPASSGRGEPVLKSRTLVDTSTNASALTFLADPTRSSGLSSASKPIAQRPIIHTIPRRPSPANNGGGKKSRNLVAIMAVMGILWLN